MKCPAPWLCAVAAGLFIPIAGSFSAQSTYPGRPIRIISPNTPGGGTSIFARLMGQKLT